METPYHAPVDHRREWFSCWASTSSSSTVATTATTLSVAQAIQETHERQRTCIARVTGLDKRVREQHMVADRCMRNKDRARARIHLLKTKQLMGKRNRLLALWLKLGEVGELLDEQSIYVDVAQHLGIATQLLEQLMQRTSIEHIHDTMDQLEEHFADVEEVNQVLSRNMMMPDDFDVDAALDDMERGENKEPPVLVASLEPGKKDEENQRRPVRVPLVPG